MERKVLVVSIGGLGDLIRVFPLLVSLRKGLPGGKIFLLSNYPALTAALRLLKPAFRPDVFYYWPLKQKGLSAWVEKAKVLLWVRRKGFDLLIDTSRGTGWEGNYRLGRLSGAKIKVGFTYQNLGLAYDFTVVFEPAKSILELNLSLLRVLGLSTEPSFGLEGNLPSPERGPYLVLHAGAQSPGRNPPRPFWKKVVSELKKAFPKAALVAIGQKNEASFWAKQKGIKRYFSLSLKELAGLIAGARLFIGVDSGPLHLAVATRRPTIGLFGPTLPEQVVGRPPFFRALSAQIPCSPCYRHLPGEKPDCGHAHCMKTLSIQKLMDYIEELNPNLY